MRTFKTKLQQYCAYKDWIFNPPELLTTDSEMSRNDIRKKENNEDTYYFYIDTIKSGNLPVKTILGIDDTGGAEDTPIFG